MRQKEPIAYVLKSSWADHERIPKQNLIFGQHPDSYKRKKRPFQTLVGRIIKNGLWNLQARKGHFFSLNYIYIYEWTDLDHLDEAFFKKNAKVLKYEETCCHLIFTVNHQSKKKNIRLKLIVVICWTKHQTQKFTKVKLHFF